MFHPSALFKTGPYRDIIAVLSELVRACVNSCGIAEAGHTEEHKVFASPDLSELEKRLVIGQIPEEMGDQWWIWAVPRTALITGPLTAAMWAARIWGVVTQILDALFWCPCFREPMIMAYNLVTLRRIVAVKLPDILKNLPDRSPGPAWPFGQVGYVDIRRYPVGREGRTAGSGPRFPTDTGNRHKLSTVFDLERPVSLGANRDEGVEGKGRPQHS